MSIRSAASAANYLEAPAASTIVQPGTPFCGGAWVYVETAPGATSFQVIASSFDGAANGWEFGFGGVGSTTLYFGWQVGGSYSDYDDGFTTAIPLNQWVYVAFRYGIDGGQVRAVSLNFREKQRTSGGVANMASVSHKLRIRQSSDNPGSTFIGRIAQFRMYSGILSLYDLRRQSLSSTLPSDLRGRCIADLPLTQYPGSATVQALDLSNSRLGLFAKTGTLTYTADPPPMAARFRTLLLTGAAAAASDPIPRGPILVQSQPFAALEI